MSLSFLSFPPSLPLLLPPPLHSPSLSAVILKALLSRLTADRRQTMGDCSEMAKVVVECLAAREKVHPAILSDLRRVVCIFFSLLHIYFVLFFIFLGGGGALS